MLLKGNKILITGSAGFIGFHLARHLLQKEYTILGLDGFTPYYDINLKKNRTKILEKFENFKNYNIMLEDIESLTIRETNLELTVKLLLLSMILTGLHIYR